DAANAEEEWAENFEGKTFANQTCLAAAICRQLALLPPEQDTVEIGDIAKALGTGLCAMRLLRSDGHGPAGVQPTGFPLASLARELIKPSQAFSHVVVPKWLWEAVEKLDARTEKGNPNVFWKILSQTQN